MSNIKTWQERQNGHDLGIANQPNMQAEITELRAALAKAEQSYREELDKVSNRNYELRKENQELRAKLTALEGQEPVGYALPDSRPFGGMVITKRKLASDSAPIYAAAGAAPAPAGWQLVPLEPTPEMLYAADHGRWKGSLEAQYRNMLAAAAKAP